MIVRHLLTALTAPLSLAVVAFVLGAIAGLCGRLFKRSRWLFKTRVFCVVTGVLVLWLFSTPVVSEWMLEGLQRQYPVLDEAHCPHADAIVVLGGAVRSPTVQDPIARLTPSSDRVWTAARLFHAGCAPIVFVSAGGEPDPDRLSVEAVSIMQLLVDLKVPASAIRNEAISTSTHQNALETRAALHGSHILLVTSGFHMPRAVLEFRRAGFVVTPAVADLRVVGHHDALATWWPSAAALETAQIAIKERLGLLWARYTG